jgi:hypothetical protein
MVDPSLIFNRKKIKYANLEEFISVEMNDRLVNVFIDLTSLFDIFRIDFYKPIFDDLVSESNTIAAELFNFIGHYRKFFSERRNCGTNFILIYNSGRDRIREEEYPDIWTERREKTFKPKFINFFLNKAKTIAKFIPDVSIIDGENIQTDIVPYVLLSDPKYNKNVLQPYNFFISDDELFVQYMKYVADSYMLLANHQSNKIIHRNSYFCHIFEKNKYSIKDNKASLLPDSCLNFYLAIRGYEGIPILREKEKQRKCLTRTEEYNTVKRSVEDMNVYDKEEISIIKKRMNLFDASTCYLNVTEAEKIHILNQINDNSLVSPKGLMELNKSSLKEKINISLLF